MRGAGTTGEAGIRWVAESLGLSHGTGPDGSRWRLRYDGALWNAEQLDGTWRSHGARTEYRAARMIAEQHQGR